MGDESLYRISSQTGINERKLHRNLNICIAAGILTTPLTGTFGLAYAGAILVGKALRRYVIRDTREAYNAQKKLEKTSKSYKTPKVTRKVRMNEDYSKNMREGSEIIKQRLDAMSPEQADKIEGIVISERRRLFRKPKLEVIFEDE